MRRLLFGVGEYYHIYNRGVDKRDIVRDRHDTERFLKALDVFNDTETIGSITELERFAEENRREKGEKLIDIVCYCLNPNHFHLLLREKIKQGISRFMMKVSGGYSRYFNIRHKRVGALFQGPFKAKHVNNNSYLLHLSAYINLNNKLHNIGNRIPDIVRSSMDEYANDTEGLCEKGIILDQFDTPRAYNNFVYGELPHMISMRDAYEEIKHLMLD